MFLFIWCLSQFSLLAQGTSYPRSSSPKWPKETIKNGHTGRCASIRLKAIFAGNLRLEMEINQAFRNSSDNAFKGSERRLKPRIYDSIPLRVRRVEEKGKRYEFESVACDLSAGGIRLTAPSAVEKGEKLTFLIRFSLFGSMPAVAPILLAKGVVLRSHKRPDGSYQFAAAFTRHRFL